jgi:hypothetical protein
VDKRENGNEESSDDVFCIFRISLSADSICRMAFPIRILGFIIWDFDQMSYRFSKSSPILGAMIEIIMSYAKLPSLLELLAKVHSIFK